MQKPSSGRKIKVTVFSQKKSSPSNKTLDPIHCTNITILDFPESRANSVHYLFAFSALLTSILSVTLKCLKLDGYSIGGEGGGDLKYWIGTREKVWIKKLDILKIKSFHRDKDLLHAPVLKTLDIDLEILLSIQC